MGSRKATERGASDTEGAETIAGAADVADAAGPEAVDTVDGTAALAAEVEGAAAMAGTTEGAVGGQEIAAEDKAGVDTDADEIGAKTVMGVNNDEDEDEAKEIVVVVCVIVVVIV